jgi:hypothetical protein
MPEQLTKHPEITMRVLRGAGGKCGEGLKPELLVSCPPARFCKMPDGEICVYGLDDAARMTQITKNDWRAIQVQQKESVPALHTVPLGTLLIAVVISILAGMLIDAWINAIRHRRQVRRARLTGSQDGG